MAGNQNRKNQKNAHQVIEITVHQGEVKQQEQNQMKKIYCRNQAILPVLF